MYQVVPMEPAEQAFQQQEALKTKMRNAPLFKLRRAQEADESGVFAGRKVLVIEDNRDSAESLRMILDMLGYEVALAYAGDEGVEAAKNNPPDIIICDIGLPGMDGYGVARTLRKDSTTVKIPLIALTAYGNPADRDRAIKNGFDHFLVKPADPVILLRLLADPHAKLDD